MDSAKKIIVKPALYDQVMAVIEKRTKLNPVKCAELAKMFGITEPKSREIIHYLRFTECKPIAARTTGHRGYWLARTLNEWLRAERSLRGRAVSMLAGLNKIADRNFSGQQPIF